MKIIKPGKKKRGPPQTITDCDECGCKFSFTASEAVFHKDWRDGDYYEIACPECKTPVLLDASLVKS